MSMLLAALTLAGSILTAPDPVDVAVTLRDQRVIEGRTVLPAVRLTTDYGSAEVRPDHLAGLELGTLDILQTVEGVQLEGRSDLGPLTLEGRAEPIPREDIRSLTVVQRAVLKPGLISTGISRSRVTYYLRAPEAYGGEARPAIVLLHASGANAREYLDAFAQTWPGLAEEFVLIGIDGERPSLITVPGRRGRDYSFANFAGRSLRAGQAGSERESPALVAEVLTELRPRLRLSRVFLGGHAQGGYVTYSVLMNYPDLIDGAFPMGAGVLSQCEPSAFGDGPLRARQRTVPLVIVHAKNDPGVRFGTGRYAYECFEEAGFTRAVFLTDERAGERFADLPVDEAVRWLDEVTSKDPTRLAAFAKRSIDAGRFRDACAGLSRLREVSPADPLAGELQGTLARACETQTLALTRRIRTASEGDWVPEFLEYRERFGGLPDAQPVLNAYDALRRQHQDPAEKLFERAQAAFAVGDEAKGYALYQRIASELFASSFFRMVTQALSERDIHAHP